MRKKIITKSQFFIFFVIVLPLLLISTRDGVIRHISSNRGVFLVESFAQKPKECLAELCKQTNYFDLNSIDLSDNEFFSVGFYGAQIDSYLRVNKISHGEINTISDIRVTWPRFRVWSIDKNELKKLYEQKYKCSNNKNQNHY